jgi:hypothetical protein
MTKFVIIVLTFLTFNIAHSQNYILPNEELIYSFETLKGKKMVLAKDKTDNYIVYRFGTKIKVELEYPEKTKESWQKFTYSFYMRGGGTENEGMDLNYVCFINNDTKYIIYDNYIAVGNEQKIGVKIIDLKSIKTIDLKANKKTRKGTLTDLRDNNLIKTSEEIFD